jgi:arylsulfatase A-like enzyme
MPRLRPRLRMSHVVFPALLAGIMALVLGSCSYAPPRNIVLIVVDTLRRDHLEPYGATVRTPNIQALADRGRVFGNLVASFHQTTMSMGAMFTGRTPSIESRDRETTLPWTGRSWCGMARFVSEPAQGCIPREIETLPERLQGAGWFTAGVVSNRLLFAPSGFERGFDVWREVGASADNQALGPSERLALRSASRVLDAVGGALARAPRERLFLYIHYLDVHDYLPARTSYADSVESFDAGIGALFDALERVGLFESAVIILTSDHGESLSEKHPVAGKSSHRGNPSFQTVLELPLIIAPAEGLAKEGVPESMLRTQDLFGLIEGIAGLPETEAARAEPLGLQRDELLLTERRFLTYRKGRWKSMINRRDPSRSALFDLSQDPGETFNWIDHRPDVYEAHRRRVDELAGSLASGPLTGDAQSERDRDRLRALGYLE